METLKIVALVGVVAAAFAIGLAFAWGAISGTPVGWDEVARPAILSFVVAASAIGVLRMRHRPG